MLIYGLALALGVTVLNTLDYAFRARMYPSEIYLGLLALGFLAVGIWAGMWLVQRKAPKTERAEPGNEAAQASLGISGRELEVLKALAEGLANKEIARQLDISPNTVKTHVSRLFEKLDAGNRTEAVNRARGLRILP
ncbi:helix-turn-helix transcriptional regulator [Ahniella affigens]|uniref:Helix-turn-helix transcriptional regulator n=1 Tax=Ahniella affigens TaxID=2021234 RepID=A0A2P1PYW4_9GAMM|nr:helix-turn-helix transcriptional regulator [Ahniella affigens]